MAEDTLHRLNFFAGVPKTFASDLYKTIYGRWVKTLWWFLERDEGKAPSVIEVSPDKRKVVLIFKDKMKVV